MGTSLYVGNFAGTAAYMWGTACKQRIRRIVRERFPIAYKWENLPLSDWAQWEANVTIRLAYSRLTPTITTAY